MTIALKDFQRSYFGLGWEFARQNKSLKDNPFSKHDEFHAYEQFIEGFNSYTPSKTAIYEDNGVEVNFELNAPDNLLKNRTT